MKELLVIEKKDGLWYRDGSDGHDDSFIDLENAEFEFVIGTFYNISEADMLSKLGYSSSKLGSTYFRVKGTAVRLLDGTIKLEAVSADYRDSDDASYTDEGTINFEAGHLVWILK